MKFIDSTRAHLVVVWTLAFEEIRFDLRLTRTWFVVAFALLVGVTNTIEQVNVYSQLSAVGSGTFMHSPLLSPTTIFPDFQIVITFGLVFFGIEIVSRDRIARMDEVIGAIPISNSQIVFGRALGLSTLFFLLFAAFMCVYVVVAVLCERAFPNLGFGSPEPYSMLATLVTDALPYLFFWIATVMFLTVLVRFRVLAAVLAIGLMLLMYWLQNNAPMYLLDVLGTYSLSTQLSSELAPNFTSSAIVSQRLALILLAIALLYWTAYLLPRLNTVRTRKPVALAASITVVAGIGFSIVHAQTSSRLDQFAGWRDHHAKYDSTSQIDIQRLTGQIELDPGGAITIDLVVDFVLVQQLHQDDSLVFSLNPGYEIEHLALGNHQAAFSFESGLLRVVTPRNLERNAGSRLRIKAHGPPDSSFAYLDAAIDPMTSDAVSAYGLFLLGSDAAINRTDYVALTSAIAWYPMAGPHLDRDAISLRPRDYFDVNLEVLTPIEWHVGGPGKSGIEVGSDRRVHTFTPSIPIHEIGLFAAQFERRAKSIAGINFELLVSPKHTQNLEIFKAILDDIEAEIEERIAFALSRGFEFPFKTYTIVETPIYLRTYGGGWQMPSTQSIPGVFLLREGMFLSANFQSIADSVHRDADLTDEEKRQRLLAYLTGYFGNDVIGGDVSKAFVDNFVRFRAEPTGPRAEWFGFLIEYLASEVISQSSGFYSVQNLKTVGTWSTARLASFELDAERTGNTLNRLYFNRYIERPEVWELMLEGSSKEPSTLQTPRNQLHAGYLYSKTMGELILDWFGPEEVGTLLRTLVDRYKGTAFTYDDFNVVASELGMSLRDRFGDWLHDIRPAGFVASAFTTERLPDDSNGSPVFEHTFHVQNREERAGLFRVSYQFAGAGDLPIYLTRSTEPMALEGDSSAVVSIQVDAPIRVMKVIPYFSLNRYSFDVHSVGGQDIPAVSRDPAPLIQPSDWQLAIGDGIYIDDLDPGFMVDPPNIGAKPRFSVRMISLNQPDPELVSTDQGLRLYSIYSNRSETGWTRQQVDTSFGLYRRTLARAEHESTSQRAHFRAYLPHAGSWNLHYHLPDIADVRYNLFDTRGRDGLTSSGRVKRPDLDISVAQVGRVRSVVSPGDDLVTGWNPIGTFELETGEVKVSISTETTVGTVIADAIFWERASSSER
ncbi:MAG: hypothetical protein OXG15_03115 [Gammaproteobacteria bacterium]|nr:hypothetical protein [Gammaproteobacteria bacterium]